MALDTESQQKLEAFGYAQELKRGIGLIGNLSLTLSVISPTTSVFIMVGAAVAFAGTGVAYAYVLGGIIALMMGLCFAELGAAYPIAGGSYSIVLRELGKLPGFLTVASWLIQGITLPATVAGGMALYLCQLFPALPQSIVASASMLLITVIALLGISFNARVAAVLLFIEFAATVFYIIVCWANLAQPLSVIFTPSIPADGGLTPVAFSMVLAALVPVLFSFNGYDGALTFSEETLGVRQNVWKSVIIACAAAVGLETLAAVGGMLAAPSLLEFASAEAPLTYTANAILGEAGTVLLILAVVIAMFACALACVSQFARIVYTSGRDRMWPVAVSSLLARIHPTTRVPWVSVLVLGLIGTVLVFFTSLLALVTFTGVLIVTVYALTALSAIVSRIRHSKLDRPFRMPLWPLPPLIALGGTGLALWSQSLNDIYIAVGLFALAVIYYLAYLRPRSDSLMQFVLTPMGEPEEEAATAEPATT